MSKKEKKYTISFYIGGGKIEDWYTFSDEDKNRRLKKAWYVLWYYRHPESGKMVRQQNLKMGVNRFSTFRDRKEVLYTIKDQLEVLIKNGYSPFEESLNEDNLTYKDAFEKAYAVKKNEISIGTYEDYKYRCDKFIEFLDSKNVSLYVRDITKRQVSDFLDQFKNTNSNNFKRALSSVFSVMAKKEYIATNFIKELDGKKETNVSKERFDYQKVRNLLEAIKKDDLRLYVFISLVSYSFWRGIEVVRLKRNEIDFEKRLMVSDAKNHKRKVKIIADIVYDDLKQFSKGKKGYIFSPHKNGEWAVKDETKREYFDQLLLKYRRKNDVDFRITIHEFRHVHITWLYDKLRESKTVKETIEQLSLITGHKSNAIWKYIHSNDIELPKDPSNLFK